ncbi:hypothetical protein PSTT_15252 [Puccinia striiformis]|uniref:Uncharacterized protein n=1 Tax=Puccinia striiformis TaxID=27350 RepID=A0A2S4UIP4_9BASI|nr:hypothetical protein PSTT_15252 [Puccinia striiformis]
MFMAIFGEIGQSRPGKLLIDLWKSHLHKIGGKTMLINQAILNWTGWEPYTSRAKDVFHSPGMTIQESRGVTPIPFEWARREIEGGDACHTHRAQVFERFPRERYLDYTGIYNGLLRAQITAGPPKEDKVVIRKTGSW